jgi:hypothetical protein
MKSLVHWRTNSLAFAFHDGRNSQRRCASFFFCDSAEESLSTDDVTWQSHGRRSTSFAIAITPTATYSNGDFGAMETSLNIRG